ncbi:replication initiation factor domain-containing protein [Streptococcus suis]|uniref:replication initiation factor domain-containing protein n=1 Tax=Streptococcus suis TaxID=1307 RepID=UPI00240F62F6|nr:replication initiation factor domain-containing protein [Streptococcus suis]MDG3136918.1 XRE family transcriptional regulator [Streptococcus suis]
MAKEPIVAAKHLIQLRKNLKMSQKVFAEVAKVNVRSLRAYEQSKRGLSISKFSEIKQALGYVDSSSGSLRVMIDYLRITFMEVRDLEYFVSKYLFTELKYFTSREKNLMMYTHLWTFGDIWIFDYTDKSLTGNYQITLQLSGQGCRQMEVILEREGLTWGKFLQAMHFERKDMRVKRLDVAMDEMWKGYDKEQEHFQLSELIGKVYRKEVQFDRLKKWNHIGGGSLEDLEDSQGISVYFGSRQSDLHFNFYEKRYEFAKKEKMTVFESLEVFGVWNRFEIRFANGKAQSVVDEFVCGVDIAEIAKGVVNKEICVYEGLSEYGAFVPDKKWQSLFGGVEPLKLSTCPEPYSIERTVKWLISQVSNSLVLVQEVDKKLATDYLRIIFDAGELTDEALEVLEHLSYQERELIDYVVHGGNVA